MMYPTFFHIAKLVITTCAMCSLPIFSTTWQIMSIVYVATLSFLVSTAYKKKSPFGHINNVFSNGWVIGCCERKLEGNIIQ
jgi:hypothetical protein